MNGILPRLRQDLTVKSRGTGPDAAYDVGLPGGPMRSFTSRVYACVQALEHARDLSSWFSDVQRRYPEVTVTQLERLLRTLVDVGFAVVVEPSALDRPVVKNSALHGGASAHEAPPWNPDSTEPGGPDDDQIPTEEGDKRARRLNADITQVTTLPVMPKPRAYADIRMSRNGTPQVVVLHRTATGVATQVSDRQAWILSRLDGKRTVQEIIDQDAVAFDELKLAVRALAAHGFIDDDAGLVPERAPLTAEKNGPSPLAIEDALSLEAENTVVRMLNAAGQAAPLDTAQRFDGSGPIRAAPGGVSSTRASPSMPAHEPAEASPDQTNDAANVASSTETIDTRRGSPDAAATVGDEDEPLSSESSAVDAPEARRRRFFRRVRAVAAPLVIIGALVGVSTQVTYPLRITYECEIRPVDRAGVRAPLDGILSEVLVDEGQRIESGAVLARIANADLRVAVVKSQSALERARAELKLLLEGSREEEIARARSRVAGLAREVDLAQGRVSRTRKLVKDGVAPRDDLDRAEGELASLQGQLSQARAEWKLLQAGTRPEEQRRKEAEIRSLEAQLDLDQRGLEATEIKSPMSGMLVTKKPRELINSRIAAGDVIFEILEPLEMRADVFVAERDFDVLQIGLPLRVKVTAYPTTTFEGKVTRIAQEVERRDIENVIRIEGIMQNLDGKLLPNMTGFAEIEAEERTLFDLGMRRVIRWFRVRFLI
jgi:multidrug resistance efflux pump